ncbi:uncharacterized protein LOC113294782 [Papaver somniferum]|uniref:uncharacterized protein LOC113294782 n=1 Tax=Papaver somniferum TaxID=3469 RepID=UPI000E6FA789|nr:uncharacterized protein LOC113294782 [Papaver somniferum]
MLKDRYTTAVQIGRIYEPSIEGPISDAEETFAVQTRSMREADKEANEEMKESDDEDEESDKDQSMFDGGNEDEAKDDWRIPIHQYLDKGTLPADVKEERELESKAAMYNLRAGILYRRSFLVPLMRCLSRTEGRKILQDIHSGDAGNHSGRRSLAVKAKMQGYYWLTMDED